MAKKNKPVPLQERWATEKDDPIRIIREDVDINPKAGEKPKRDDVISKQ